MQVIVDLCLDEVKDYLSKEAKNHLLRIQRQYGFSEEYITGELKKIINKNEPVNIKDLELFLTSDKWSLLL